jgi:hypothetical protein
MMNEDTVNLEIRKFLKKVGITSQQEIEKVLQEAIEAGRLQGNETLVTTMTLEIKELGFVHTVDGKITLE